MKPFRLHTVERLRNRELDAKAQELHTAAAVRDKAVAECDRMIEQLAGGGSIATGLGTRSGADLDLANNFRQVLRQLILDQEERIAALNQALSGARAAWLTARGQLRAVQALHDRHRVVARAEQARLDQRELDELAGSRHTAARDRSADTEVEIR